MNSEVDRSVGSIHDLPSASLAGFESVKRFYDPRVGRVVAKILPGEYYVSNAREYVTTLLGSCVAACIWDPSARVGGMNHFTVPGLNHRGTDAGIRPDAARYGIFAMELLVNSILTNGGDRTRLRAKLAGGGHVVESSLDIGRKNVVFARSYLADEGFELVGEHVEGFHPRRVIFDPCTGWARVLRAGPGETSDLDETVRQEQAYSQTIQRFDPAGDVELF